MSDTVLKVSHRDLICNLYFLALTLFSTLFLFYKDTIFEKILLNIKCIFRFSLEVLFVTLFVLKIMQPDIITNVNMPCKVPVIIIRF